jgi:hypothetical protein
MPVAARITGGEAPPPEHPELWRALPFPADDVRTRVGSPYAGVGLLDTP